MAPPPPRPPAGTAPKRPDHMASPMASPLASPLASPPPELANGKIAAPSGPPRGLPAASPRPPVAVPQAAGSTAGISTIPPPSGTTATNQQGHQGDQQPRGAFRPKEINSESAGNNIRSSSSANNSKVVRGKNALEKRGWLYNEHAGRREWFVLRGGVLRSFRSERGDSVAQIHLAHSGEVLLLWGRFNFFGEFEDLGAALSG